MMEDTAEAFFGALGEANVAEGVRIAVDLHEGGMTATEVMEHLVVPAQRRVGEYWAADMWDVAREHAATHVCDQAVAALARRMPPPQGPRGRIVLACADAEWHALPARLAAETLRAQGWEVVFLGAATPARHLVRFLETVGPDAVGLSCTFAPSLPRARATIAAVRSAAVPVLAGGPGFGPGGRWAKRLGATAWAEDGSTAVLRLLEDWPAYTEPVPQPNPPDEEHARFARHEAELGAEVSAALLGGVRATWPIDSYGVEEIGECGGYVTGFLSAALLVDDAEMMTSSTSWLADLLEARNVGRGVLAGAYDVLAKRLGAFPRAQGLLDAGRALLPA